MTETYKPNTPHRGDISTQVLIYLKFRLDVLGGLEGGRENPDMDLCTEQTPSSINIKIG